MHKDTEPTVTTDTQDVDSQPETTNIQILDRFRNIGINAVRLLIEPVTILRARKQFDEEARKYWIEHREELIIALEAEIRDTKAYLESGITANGGTLPDCFREQIQVELPICKARLKWLRKMR